VSEEGCVTKHPGPSLSQHLSVVTEENHEGVSRSKFELDLSQISSYCAEEVLTPFLFVIAVQYVFCEVEIELLSIIYMNSKLQRHNCNWHGI
jgi:hypothetical protein